MASVKKYLRVGGDANNLKDYEFCRVTDRHCQRHVHIEKIPAAVKIDWSDNAAVFAAVQSGEVSLDDFNAFIEQAETNAGNKEYENALYMLGRLRSAGTAEINEAVSAVQDPETISRLVEDLDNLEIDHYRSGSKINLFYHAVLMNPNTSSAIQNELLDKIDTFTMSNVARETHDPVLLTKIFNHNESARIYGELVKNDSTPALAVEGALDKYPGLFKEYHSERGFDATTEKYAIEFYKNPIVEIPNPNGSWYGAQSIYEQDGYRDREEQTRKVEAEKLILANSSYDTVKSVVGEIQGDRQLGSAATNTNIPVAALKEAAQTTLYSSGSMVELLQSRGDVPADVVTKLKAPVRDFEPAPLTDREKSYVTEWARKKPPYADTEYQNTFGQYFSAKEQYDKLLKETAEGKDITTPAYKRARARLALANRWKDVLRTRAALS
jgi:hypothetical protein